MSVGSTLQQLVEKVANRAATLTEIVATDGSLTMIESTSHLYQPNSFWVGAWVYWKESQLITDNILYGPKSPSTLVGDDTQLGGSTAWSNPTNAKTSNDAYATVTLDSPDASKSILATNFGFSLPNRAVISSIEILVEAKASAPLSALLNIQPVVNGLIYSSTKPTRYLSTSDGDMTPDTGGWIVTLSGDDVRATNFGCVVKAIVDDGAGITVSVDHIKMFLYYTIPVGSPAEGEERQISAYAQSTQLLTVPLAFSDRPSAGDTFQLYDRWSRAQIVHAINEALRQAAGFWHRRVVDESLTTVLNTWSYDLSELDVLVERRFGLSRVWVKYNTPQATYPYRLIRNYELRWNDTTPVLQFNETLPINTTLRLEYMASPSAPLAAADDQTDVEEETWLDEFVKEWALFELWQQRMGRAPSQDKRTDGTLAQQHRDEAERMRRMHRMRLPSNTFPKSEWEARMADGSRWLAAHATPTA